MSGEYIIICDTNRYKDCLVCIAGNTLEKASEVLNRMLSNPTEDDKKIMSGCTNFRVSFVEEKDCWWHRNCD